MQNFLYLKKFFNIIIVTESSIISTFDFEINNKIPM
jgi:hypothetical protein